MVHFDPGDAEASAHAEEIRSGAPKDVVLNSLR